MKLRLARKIFKAIGTPDGDRYSEFQKQKAIARFSRTRSERELEAWWARFVSEHGEAIREWFGWDQQASTPKG